jgi:predicted O-methyltransferase YrrM
MRFADFMIRSGNRYQVHSPFLYSFIDYVIRPRKKVEMEEEIELIRNKCINNSKIILKTDYGAGSGNQETLLIQVPVSKVARSSLTSRRHARRLNRLVRLLNSKNILEIGTSLGITTAYMAMANPDARIITLEGCPELSRIARSHFEELGLENVDLIVGRFEDTLEKALARLGSVDLVYLDGNHRRGAVLDYFSKCLEFANNDTVIIVDDIHSSKEMEEAWDEARTHERVTVSLDLFHSGWILLRKESSRQHFRLRYI